MGRSNLVTVDAQEYVWVTVLNNLRVSLEKVDNWISDALIDGSPKYRLDSLYRERQDISIAITQIGAALGLDTIGGERP